MRVSRRRPFYGWLIVAVIFLGGTFNSGISLWGIGIFVTPMEEDLGWSRTTFFAALSVRGIIAGLSSGRCWTAGWGRAICCLPDRRYWEFPSRA